MISIEVKCKNCNTRSIVEENKLLFAEEKKMEVAYCLECEEKIYENQTDGWFTVKVAQVAKLENEDCTFPMP